MVRVARQTHIYKEAGIPLPTRANSGCPPGMLMSPDGRCIPEGWLRPFAGAITRAQPFRVTSTVPAYPMQYPSFYPFME